MRAKVIGVWFPSPKKTKVITVTLSRTYSYEAKDLDGDTPEEQREDATSRAYNDFSDEMVYFENNPQDFFSHKVTESMEVVIP